MNHRGPDGKGEYLSDQVVLGMDRLAIVDCEGGSQPIWNEDQSICVVANGEIYNHGVLRELLMGKGHRFQTGSDVEVLVHLYEEYGERLLERLEGIYAFSIWDVRNKRLMVVRDRVGVKPLYYMESESAFLFSSELNALLQSNPSMPFYMDLKALSEYHGFRFVTAPHTIVNEIKKLPPAHWALVSDGQMTIQKYWSPQSATQINDSRSPENLLDLFEQSVINQEAPEVKSGLFLSAGLDSSALLAMQTKYYEKQPLTFTVGFEKPSEWANRLEYDELHEAARTAEIFGAEHYSQRFSAQSVLSELPKIIASLDEPIADPTAIPLWLVSKIAREAGCKVVYSGEGLDEIFYGYSVYNVANWLEFLGKFPTGVRRFALRWVNKLGISGKGVLERSLWPISEWYQGIGGAFTRHEKERLFTATAWGHGQLPVVQAMSPILQSLDTPSGSVLKKMADFDFHAWLPDNTLAKSDQVTMAHSLELRVPYLDHPIIEYAQRLPSHQKRRGKVGKLAARQAFHEILPEEILKRPKNGFPVPITAWIFGEWKDFIGETLLHSGSFTRDLYKKNEIEKLMATETGKRKRAGRLLWTLLMLEMWLNAHPQVNLAFEAHAAQVERSF
jgi:asparagine synthase (glutamine-hydrolysing)